MVEMSMSCDKIQCTSGSISCFNLPWRFLTAWYCPKVDVEGIFSPYIFPFACIEGILSNDSHGLLSVVCITYKNGIWENYIHESLITFSKFDVNRCFLLLVFSPFLGADLNCVCMCAFYSLERIMASIDDTVFFVTILLELCFLFIHEIVFWLNAVEHSGARLWFHAER